MAWNWYRMKFQNVTRNLPCRMSHQIGVWYFVLQFNIIICNTILSSPELIFAIEVWFLDSGPMISTQTPKKTLRWVMYATTALKKWDNFEMKALSLTINISLSIITTKGSFGILRTRWFQNCPWLLDLIKTCLRNWWSKRRLPFILFFKAHVYIFKVQAMKVRIDTCNRGLIFWDQTGPMISRLKEDQNSLRWVSSAQWTFVQPNLDCVFRCFFYRIQIHWDLAEI